ncbi:unnamed protein product, partial [Owenia fusiformis]
VTPVSKPKSIFDHLGLVKKPSELGSPTTEQPRSQPGPLSKKTSEEDATESSGEVVHGVIEELVDTVFPAEAAAQDALTVILDTVDSTVSRKSVSSPVNMVKDSKPVDKDETVEEEDFTDPNTGEMIPKE